MNKYAFVVLAFSLLLSACGFRPMYGVNRDTPVGVEEKLAVTSIGTIPNREGQYLRNALIDRFHRDQSPQNPQYRLTIAPLRESLVDLDTTKSSDATRGQIRIETTMTLKDGASGDVLLKRELRAIASYNVLGSEFATRVTEDNARANALDDLARQVELQLGLYFKR